MKIFKKQQIMWNVKAFDPGEVDVKMRQLIIDLNNAGYETGGCCQGGKGHFDYAYVSFNRPFTKAFVKKIDQANLITNPPSQSQVGIYSGEIRCDKDRELFKKQIKKLFGLER